MQEPFNIVFIISALIIIGFFIFHFPGRYNSKNENKVADMPFYIPGVLEKPSTEKPLRKVSDITTGLLRKEISRDREVVYNLNRSFKICTYGLSKESQQYKCEVQNKDERDARYWQKHWNINIRLSIKQTKP